MFCCLEVFCRCKPLSCPSGPCVLMEFVDLSYSPEGPLLILFDQVCHIREDPRDRSRKEFRAAVAEDQPAAALSPLTVCQISLERSGGAVVAKRAVPSHATVDPSGDSEAVVEDSPASSGPGVVESVSRQALSRIWSRTSEPKIGACPDAAGILCPGRRHFVGNILVHLWTCFCAPSAS